MSMLALKYDDARTPLPRAALRRWLRGQWALLFSHPDDFASYGFEADRWLVHVREAFAATGIRPLALPASQTGLASDWITAAGGCTAGPLDEIALDHGRRFVVTLDDSLRARRTFFYTLQGRLPSPMDLALAAERLRRQSAAKICKEAKPSADQVIAYLVLARHGS